MVNPGDHLEFTVIGKCQNQDLVNTLHYKVNPANATSDTLAVWLTEFIAQWRANWIANASQLYQVFIYQARKIGTMVFLPVVPPMSPTSRPAMRYTEQVVVAGTGSDVGDVADDLIQPTFNAIGVHKVTGIVTDRDYVTLGNEKLIKGSMRLGPVLEADSIGVLPNELGAVARGAYENDIENFLSLTVGANTAFMEVLSFYKNGVHRTDGADPTFACSLVNNVIVSLYITSQVTRKQGNRSGG